MYLRTCRRKRVRCDTPEWTTFVFTWRLTVVRDYYCTTAAELLLVLLLVED